MPEWAKNLADQKKAQIERRLLKDEKELSDRKLVSANLPRMWEELREAVITALDQFNREMHTKFVTYEERSHNEITLKAETVSVHLNLNPEASCLYVHSTPYKLAVVDGNGVSWHSAQGNPISAKMLAESLVSQVVNVQPYS